MTSPTSTPPSLLELRGIRKSFGGVRALRGVSFDLRGGEIHALLGENGAGKSTLIKTLGGIHTPDAGEIFIDGCPVRIASPADAARLGIRVIHQELALAPNLSVAENLFLGREPGRFGLVDKPAMKRESAARIKALGFHELNDVETRVERLPIALRQLVEITRALICDARVLVLDEPTTSLTAAETEMLFRKLESLRSHGVGIIYISHRLEETRRLANRVTVLRDGESIGTQEAAHLNEAALVKWMVGREMTPSSRRAASKRGEVVLRAEGLRNRHIHGVSIELRAGEVLGLAGLVGAGRSELARALFGVDALDAGSIEVGGKVLRNHSPQDALAAGLVLVPEDRKLEGLIMGNTVAFNAALPWTAQWIRFGWLDSRERAAIVQRALDAFAVKTSSAEAGVATLSGGNQQKVLVGRWLEQRPRVLILDEPTRGVDVGARADLFDVIARLVAEGLAVLLISSDLNEVLHFSDRIAVYRDGGIVRTGAAAEFTMETLLTELTGAAAA
jgi:ABC-type sugar transport system ATPase subunit